uniref:Vomeronasal type-1 receptor n=1 Tax=Romanomermis culicivorax TaxID=13658 RepID=A0A915KX34_ROMCU
MAWFIGLLSWTTNNLVGCTSRFSNVAMSLTFECKYFNPVFSPHSIYCYICTYSTFIFYYRCLKVLRKKSGQVADQSLVQSMHNKNSRVFRQALLIWLSLVTTLTSFRIMPFITSHVVYTIVHVFFASCSPNFAPLIPIIFSHEIRSSLKSVLCCRKIDHA